MKSVETPGYARASLTGLSSDRSFGPALKGWVIFSGSLLLT